MRLIACASESEARQLGAEEIYIAAAPDLERDTRFRRIEGEAALGKIFALRATVAYKGLWIRLVRSVCDSRDRAGGRSTFCASRRVAAERSRIFRLPLLAGRRLPNGAAARSAARIAPRRRAFAAAGRARFGAGGACSWRPNGAARRAGLDRAARPSVKPDRRFALRLSEGVSIRTATRRFGPAIRAAAGSRSRAACPRHRWRAPIRDDAPLAYENRRDRGSRASRAASSPHWRCGPNCRETQVAEERARFQPDRRRSDVDFDFAVGDEDMHRRPGRGGSRRSGRHFEPPQHMGDFGNRRRVERLEERHLADEVPGLDEIAPPAFGGETGGQNTGP